MSEAMKQTTLATNDLSTSSSSCSSPADHGEKPSFVHDDVFFYRDIYVLVENVLFKVPRAVFGDSEVFRYMLDIPQPAGVPVEGSVESNPIRIDGYTAEDFRQLLKVSIPMGLTSTQYESLTTEQWKSVLALSTAWVFHSARKTSVKYLKKARMDPVDRLVLAIKYDIDEWTVDALNSIAQREESLDHTDADRLLAVVGLDYLLKIARVRESSAFTAVPGGAASACKCPTHATAFPAGVLCTQLADSCKRSTRDFRPMIRSVFGLEE